MLRIIAAIAVLAFTIYCVVDVVQTKDDEARGLPRPMWVLITLLFPLAGGAAWLIAGRPVSILDSWLGKGRSGPPRGPTGPDDDPDFLRGL